VRYAIDDYKLFTETDLKYHLHIIKNKIELK